MSVFRLFTNENEVIFITTSPIEYSQPIMKKSLPNSPAKKAKRRVQQKSMKKYKPMTARNYQMPVAVNFKDYRTWFNLPGNTILHTLLQSYATSLTAANDFIKSCKRASKDYPPQIQSSLANLKWEDPYNSIFYTPQVIKKMMYLVYKNQKIRQLFKKCIHRWRLSRLNQVNTEDAVTGEIPVNPICVYDWKNRSKYVFEASTLFKDISERLLKSDGMFCKPLYPRNMFTNVEFTPEQMHFIIQDILKAGYSNLYTCGLVKARYSLGNFKFLYSTILKQHAVEKIFKQWNSVECADLVFDFFEMYKDYYDAHIQHPAMWEWAFENLNDGYPLIKAWRNLCKKYYMKYVSESDDLFKLSKDEIGKEAYKLLKMPSGNILNEWLRPYLTNNSLVVVPDVVPDVVPIVTIAPSLLHEILANITIDL